MKRRPWTDDEVALLRAKYANTVTREIADELGRVLHTVHAKAAKLGLAKSEGFASRIQSERIAANPGLGASGRFLPGHVPWSAGRKGYDAGGRSHETRFKPGHSSRWDPDVYCVGALRINSDGGLDIRTAPGPRSWRALHRLIWEEHNGPIPPGMAVRARNGDLHDCCDIRNLYLASRADLMRANTIHNLPPKLRSAIALVGQLKRRIRERQQQDNRRSA